MIKLLPLIQNECLKIWRKKRFLVILAILAILIPLFAYAQMKVSLNVQEQLGTSDWRIQLQQQIIDYTERMNSPRMVEEWRRWYEVSVQTLQYHLDHNVDPSTPNGVTFTKEFLSQSVGLFLPLLIMVIAADLVSSEKSGGTIKLLLSRPVRRWRVLLSKYAALTLYISLIVLATCSLAYLISGAFFGYEGWTQPVLIGFEVSGTDVMIDNVRTIDQWQFMLMQLGLIWYSCVVVGCISLMVSVLVRSTAAGMGIMLAALISGSILVNMVSSWEQAKYLFMVNLSTVNYLSGELPPISGMTLPFSLVNLAVWSIASMIVAFWYFTRQDIWNG